VIHVILGPDRALARVTLNKLLDQFDPGGDSTSRFEAPGDPIGGVSTALATRTFFAESRIVVATGYLGLLSRGTGGKAKRGKTSASSPPDQFERLFGLAESQGELILFEPDLASIPATAKSLLPATASVVMHAPARGSALVEYTRQAVEERSATIDRQTAQYLLNRLFPGHWQQAANNPAFDRPPDIEYLLTELDKLATAADGAAIDEALIDDLTTERTADHMFTLLDAVISGNQGAALREIDLLPHSSDELSRLLAMIGQQIEFSAAAVASGRPNDPLQAGKALGMPNPNRMKAVLNVAGPAAARQTVLLESAVDADRRFKTGLDAAPGDTLYRIITRSASRRG
jgi:DNA polymerase III delta subunit